MIVTSMIVTSMIVTTNHSYPVNQLFDLDAGKPKVRFDQRGLETGYCVRLQLY
jgi:hypothetical protein